MSALPKLVVITDWSRGAERLLAAVEQVVALGPEVAIQHRHPGAGIRQFLEEGRALAALCRRAGAALFVNGRLEVALLLEAHLHLPASGPDVQDVLGHLPPKRWVSVAVHDEAEALRARGASFALVSPVFGAGSKPKDDRLPLGPSGFARLSAHLHCPAYPLGGVSAERLQGLGPGIRGAAAISAVLEAADPRAAAWGLLQALGAPVE